MRWRSLQTLLAVSLGSPRRRRELRVCEDGASCEFNKGDGLSVFVFLGFVGDQCDIWS